MLPVITLNNLLEFNQTLFDGVQLPDDADGQALFDIIVLNYGEMQFLYPDWSAAKIYINSWFRSHYTSINNLWMDYQASYNPLYNKDAYYEEERTPDLQHTFQHGKTITDTPTTTITESGSTEQQYKGFDSSTFNGVSKDLPGRVQTMGGQNVSAATGTDTERDTGKETITRREYGNIGVTTSTQLVSSDAEFWQRYNWYDIVARMFACDFCVMVY